MSAESPRHTRSGGPLSVPSQPPSDRSIIDAVSGFISDVTLSASSAIDPKDVIQWARFETADINEPTSEGDSDTDISPLLLILGYGSGVQVWLIPPTGEAQEVLSWRQGTVRVLRILPTPQHGDSYASKRPLIALCDSASPGPTFCSLSFISIRGGEQVKSIKFKNQILDVLANKRSVVVSFSERFAVFDAGTLEDRMAVTTCFPCPCPLGGVAPVNPLALGDRWLAYADKKLNQSKRSSGGCEGEGVTSYTATVLHAAKSLSKGLRGLGESVAHSLAGRATSQSPSPPNADALQPGVVTILDIEGNDEEHQDTEEPYDPIVAHFVAHSDAIIALKFDTSGMLLVTADRRGHDFHVFRINPHPCGPGLASVHHLYILHRGDTTAKVQDIAISPDSRWAAISTLRGTTHIFAMSPYGGACGVRTHTSPRVVNRLSRFHRSAGLPIHTASQAHTSGSPVSDGLAPGSWFPNPRLPPYPLPTTAAPLAQLRPTANLPTHTITRNSSGRQRLSSLSEDCNAAPLLARARFGPAPAPCAARSAPAAALYLVAASGCLSHCALRVRPATNIPKEKICDETPVELEVEPIAQWPLQRPPAAADLLAPLPPNNPLLQPLSCRRCADMCMSEEERWLSQVEIVTHAGPHRRLWMGPQFVFKTYNCTGSNSSLSEAETVDVEPSAAARSTPVNMPGARPVLVDSGSASSLEHSPSDSFRRKSLLAETGRAASVCDVQLKEDLAEAMKEDHGWRERRDETDSGRASRSDCVVRAVDPQGTVTASAAPAAAAPVEPDTYTTDNADEATFRPVLRAPALAIHPDMVVRPLPRTTTIPVQTVAPMTTLSPDDPLPLNMDVVIPAALTTVQGWHASNQLEEDGKVDKIEDVAVEEKSIIKEKSPPKGKKEEVKPAAKKKTRDDEAQQKNPEEDICTTDKQKGRTEKYSVNKITEKPVEKQLIIKDVAVKTDKPMRVEKFIEQEEIISKTEKPTKKVNDEPRIKTAEPELVTEPKVDRVNVDVKMTDVNKDLKRERQRDSARERRSAECVERENVDSKSLPKSDRPPDDIHPVANTRVKKSPTSKSVSDKISEVSFKEKTKKFYEAKAVKAVKELKEAKEVREVKEVKEVKESKEISESKEIQIQKDVKETRGNIEAKEIQVRDDKKGEQSFKDIKDARSLKIGKKKPLLVEDKPAICITAKLPNKSESKANPQKRDEIKTEEQAWDLLLTEPEKTNITNISQDNKIDDKPKFKRYRKLRKTTDDVQTKADEDSFIEIHAIEEKQQPCNELVSISTPFEDTEPAISYSAKAKKSRSPKGSTFEIKDDWERKTDFLPQEQRLESCKPKSKRFDDFSTLGVLADPFNARSALKLMKYADGTASEFLPSFAKEARPNKSKSLSPYPEMCKLSDKREVADLYVIDTTEEQFPEIQITKTRKRSPQPETIIPEKEPDDRSIKSWSSIAASKKECIEKDVETNEKRIDYDKKDVAMASERNPTSSTTVSLQEKLFELCKRTDILVAECDTPTELNFFDEHHSVLDLPPLEPLDFGLDDFKLEVMRDSLIDINDTNLTSPICKINIDDILSSIKETTSKVIESSTFNLIDLEKVPAKKEKGFSVIGSHKITSQEIKLEDDKVDDGGEAMEKSSDDDVTSPIVSTDSDKEDKKAVGASAILPSSKQSAKFKKSRRKKK